MFGRKWTAFADGMKLRWMHVYLANEQLPLVACIVNQFIAADAVIQNPCFKGISRRICIRKSYGLWFIVSRNAVAMWIHRMVGMLLCWNYQGLFIGCCDLLHKRFMGSLSKSYENRYCYLLENLTSSWQNFVHTETTVRVTRQYVRIKRRSTS